MNLPKTIRTQSDDSRAQKHAVLPHTPKRHSASFRRVLVLVYGTVVLFALLITAFTPSFRRRFSPAIKSAT